MELKERDLFEYIKCPVRYQLQSNGMDIQNATANKLIYEAIKYIYVLQANTGQVPFNRVKAKWDSLCEKNKEILNPKKVIEGWGLVYRAYEYVVYGNVVFMDIDMPYKIEIPGTGICLTGQLDPLIDRGTHIEILISSLDKKLPDRIDIDTKLKHTIDAYAVKEMFKKDVVINYYSYALNKDIQTIRSLQDFNRLETIVKNVGTCINSNIIYPRETFMCSSCIARHICKSWTGQEEVK